MVPRHRGACCAHTARAQPHTHLGAGVLAALENGFSRVEDVNGRFPQVSGLTVIADLTRPAGERVTEVMVGGAPLDMNAMYTVSTNDFMGRGGDGYTMFTDAPRIVREEDAKLMANDVMVHVRNLGTFAPAIDGRITLVHDGHGSAPAGTGIPCSTKTIIY